MKSGVNLEVPLIISARGEGLLYFIAAPALVYSQNTNQVSYRYLTVNPGNTAAVVNVDGDEKLTQMGGKLYAGIGYGRALGWHAELLPYIGFSSVKEEGTTLTSIRSTDTSSQQGSFTSYGITVGGYYTPEFAKYLEFGARLGYAGSTGKIDGRDFEQNDLIAALELGLHF